MILESLVIAHHDAAVNMPLDLADNILVVYLFFEIVNKPLYNVDGIVRVRRDSCLGARDFA